MLLRVKAATIMRRHLCSRICLGLGIAGLVVEARTAEQALPFSWTSDGGFVARAFNVEGDCIPDFSYCGYRSGGAPLPAVPVRIVLDPSSGDAAPRIQAAINELASL